MLGELQKIDLIRERTGVSLREAKKFLDAAGGDVVQALMMIEEMELDQSGQQRQQDTCCGHQVFDQVKNAIKQGQKIKIKVKKDDQPVFELPATAGVVGLLAALASSELAVLGALGAVTAMAKKYTLEFEHQDKASGNAEPMDNEYN